jgi:hypothetical protein
MHLVLSLALISLNAKIIRKFGSRISLIKEREFIKGALIYDRAKAKLRQA